MITSSQVTSSTSLTISLLLLAIKSSIAFPLLEPPSASRSYPSHLPEVSWVAYSLPCCFSRGCCPLAGHRLASCGWGRKASPTGCPWSGGWWDPNTKLPLLPLCCAGSLATDREKHIAFPGIILGKLWESSEEELKQCLSLCTCCLRTYCMWNGEMFTRRCCS